MAITQVQKKIGTNVTATTIVTTFASTPTQGNLLFTAVAVAGAGGQSLTAPSGWTLVTGFPLAGDGSGNGGSQRMVAAAWKMAGSSEPAAHTWTSNASVNMDAVAYEYSGIAASPLDQTVSNFNSGIVTTFSCGTTGATTQADEVAFAFCVTAARTGESIDNGFTMGNADGSRLIIGAQILSATGTVTANTSWATTGNNAAGGIATFKAAVASSSASAGAASGAGSALTAAGSVGASSGTGSATGTAPAPMVTVLASAGLASATAMALGATASNATVVLVNAGAATALASALNASALAFYPDPHPQRVTFRERSSFRSD